MPTIDYPVIISLIGASLIGWTSGMISCYAVLKEQSLLGDAIAHAALPGICIAFLISQTKASGPLITGAIIAGILGSIIHHHHYSKNLFKRRYGFGDYLIRILWIWHTASDHDPNHSNGSPSRPRHLFIWQCSGHLREDVIIIGGLSILITSCNFALLERV